MAKCDYHVAPSGRKWAVKREGTQRVLSVHDTQGEAINAGKRLAKKDKVELVIHRRDGSIRDSDSYGPDPRRRKDAKH